MPKQKACDIGEAEIQELLFESDCKSIDNDIGNLNNDSDYDVSKKFCGKNCALGDFPSLPFDPCNFSDSDEVLSMPKKQCKKSNLVFYSWKNIGNDLGKIYDCKTFTGVNCVTFATDSKTM